MRTLDFILRGEDVLFRCSTCGGEAVIDRQVPFMAQLRAIALGHVCWVPFVMPTPRQEAQPTQRPLNSR
jgi:hypothetical protein